MAGNARNECARPARRLPGGRPRDARLWGRGTYRQHLFDRSSTKGLGRLWIDEACGERDLGILHSDASSTHGTHGPEGDIQGLRADVTRGEVVLETSCGQVLGMEINSGAFSFNLSRSAVIAGSL